MKDFIKRTAQAVRSRDAKRKRYCCVLIVNNQPALLIALADYAISDKLAVRVASVALYVQNLFEMIENLKCFVWKLATMTGG